MKNFEAQESEEESEVVHEYLQEGTICAIAAGKNSTYLLWFIKIASEREAMEDITDDYGHFIKGGTRYYPGNFLESRGPCREEFEGKKLQGEKFQLMEKNTFFFKESVVYAFTPFKEIKGFYAISMKDYCDILTFVDSSGMASL